MMNWRLRGCRWACAPTVTVTVTVTVTPTPITTSLFYYLFIHRNGNAPKIVWKMDKLEMKNASAVDERPAKRGEEACGKRGEGEGEGGGVKKAKVAQAPRCQVEKCTADLVSGSAKEYYRRHRVCELHSKARKVLLLGLDQRFCQQCSRFHILAEFDEAKRSCRRRLAGHNERRRKTSSDSSADRLDGNDHLSNSWLRHMEESSRMGMLLDRNCTAKVCKEIKNH